MKIEIIKKRPVQICLGLLFILLLLVSFPSFSYPPLSDYWEMFYSFHHLNELPGSIKWLHILNFDPVEQVGHRPLAHLFYYVFHLLFGSHFIFFNIVNFLFYFFSILVLYKFALYFCQNRFLIAIFVGFFALLFNHFNMVLWSCNVHIIVGLCMFLLGFISYIRYLKTGRVFFLFFVIPFLFVGMLCYEAFFLWPLGIIILSCIKKLKGEATPKRAKVTRVNWLVVGIMYAFYFLFYLFTKSLGTYENPAHEVFDFLKLNNLIASGFLVLFNTLYHNIAVNILPFLVFPFKVTENIYMAGPVINYIDEGHQGVVLIGGALVGILLVCFFIHLYRKKYFEELKIIGFFLFLMLSELYVVFLGKLGVNRFVYGLTEFRYQYIPNAFVILIILFVIDRFLKLTRYRKRMMYLVLTLLFVFNACCIRRVINIYNYHFVNLSKMLSSIKSGIHEGSINQDNKLYIDDDIPEYLPSLCWNIDMGERFIKRGNYQWMFSRKEVGYFAESIRDATWIIDKEEFKVIKKSSKSIFEKAKKINAGKCMQYLSLANFYKSQGEYQQAKEMFKRVIEINPRNTEVYGALGEFYKDQGRYKEAEEMFKKAIEIDPRNTKVYGALGEFYKDQGRYEEAEAMFKRAIKMNPEND